MLLVKVFLLEYLQHLWNTFDLVLCNEPLYPTGQNHSLELMFAKFATAKIAKTLNPLKLIHNRC